MEYKHILPGDIEKTSMGIIAEELKERGIEIDEKIRPIMHRVIHTSADFDYAEKLVITDGTVDRVIARLQEGDARFITDTNMALSGINENGLERAASSKVYCMADEDIAKAAKERQTTRAFVSMEKGMKEHPDAIFAAGNAPTALIALSDMIRKGASPSLVIGVPVGFVNVVESKEEILEVCRQYDIPCIVALGRKGGSNVAASICNALLYMATDTVNPDKR